VEKKAPGVCVRCMKFAPLLLLVPVIRKLRARKQPEPAKRHLLFGH